MMMIIVISHPHSSLILSLRSLFPCIFAFLFCRSRNAKFLIAVGYIYFLEPPQLIRASPPQPQVIEGNDLHLDARVQGYPYPWVTWSHRDHLLQNTSNVDSETRLKIRNVTVLEGGIYIC